MDKNFLKAIFNHRPPFLWRINQTKQPTLKKILFFVIVFAWIASPYSFADEPKEGPIQEYDDNGTLKAVYTYHEGKRSGPAQSYYPNGDIKEEVSFQNDQMQGPARKYYPDGTLYQEAYFENGELSGAGKIYDSKGNLENEYLYKEGKVIEKKIIKPIEAALPAPQDNKDNVQTTQNSTLYLRPPGWGAEEIIPDLLPDAEQMRSPQEENQQPEAEEIEEAQGEEPKQLEEEEAEEAEGEESEEAVQPRFKLEVGLESSYYTFEKPEKRDKGGLNGIASSVIYTGFAEDSRQKWIDTARVDLRYMQGDVDYQGIEYTNSIIPELKIDDVPLYIFEGRLLGGHDFSLAHGSNLNVYSGLGYRYLSEDPSDKSSFAYRRESNYVYWPLGVTYAAPQLAGWKLDTTIEFDGIMGAWEKSHLSELGVLTSTMIIEGTPYSRTGTNDDTLYDQQGWGFRASLRLEKIGSKIDFIAEPFFSHWNIKDSKWEQVFVDGVLFSEVVGGQTWYAERRVPKNNTTEFGTRFLIRF